MKKKKFFDSEKQVSEFNMALKGRMEIPPKFVYLREGAYNWDRLVENRKYKIGKTEFELIKSEMDNILSYLKNKVNIIDLGCGNGRKAILFIRALSKTHKPVSYIALDISTDMLALAIRNIKMEIGENLNTQTFVTDFEEGNFAQITGMLKKVYYPNNLLMVLCNTIGNAFDKHRVLANIRESMGFSDYLLIGMELLRENRDVKDILEHYKTDHVYNLIFIGLEKAGVKREDGHFKVEFNREKSQVETCFIFDRDVKTRFEGEELSFNRGDKVILMISYKSTKQELEKLLEKTGFRVDRFFVNKKGNYALILCHPSKL